ncbi:CynX/NimT family MFS transporter [Gordonia effusa]|nr:MFS transporter [Gordonia effusa]
MSTTSSEPIAAQAIPSTTNARSLSVGRAIVLVAIVLFSLSLRSAVTSMAPLLSRMSTEIGFGDAMIGVFGMMPTAMFGIAGIVAPTLGRRFGLERLTLVAVAATVIGIAARSAVSSTSALLILSGVALAGMGIGNIVIPPLVKRYFGDRVAMMSTVYITCVQLGTAVPAAIAVPLADAHGWRISLAIWALVPLAALLPWVWVVRARRGHDVADHTGEPTGPSLPVWRAPLAWGMSLMFGMTSLVTYSMFAWVPRILTDAGASESFGGAMVAVFSAVGFAATLFAPTVTARFANPFGWVLIFVACLLAGFAGLLWAPLHGTVLWVALLGLGPTTFPMALTLINLRTRTPSGSASLSGFTQGVGYLLACAGPLFFGLLHTWTHGWTVPFAFLVGAVLVLVSGAYVACKPRYLEDSLASK